MSHVCDITIWLDITWLPLSTLVSWYVTGQVCQLPYMWYTCQLLSIYMSCSHVSRHTSYTYGISQHDWEWHAYHLFPLWYGMSPGRYAQLRTCDISVKYCQYPWHTGMHTYRHGNHMLRLATTWFGMPVPFRLCHLLCQWAGIQRHTHLTCLSAPVDIHAIQACIATSMSFVCDSIPSLDMACLWHYTLGIWSTFWHVVQPCIQPGMSYTCDTTP